MRTRAAHLAGTGLVVSGLLAGCGGGPAAPEGFLQPRDLQGWRVDDVVTTAAVVTLATCETGPDPHEDLDPDGAMWTYFVDAPDGTRRPSLRTGVYAIQDGVVEEVLADADAGPSRCPQLDLGTDPDQAAAVAQATGLDPDRVRVVSTGERGFTRVYAADATHLVIVEVGVDVVSELDVPQLTVEALERAADLPEET